MASKPFIFTLMPFSHEFDDIYKLGIKETAESFGAYCERVDEQIFQGSILDRIINQISKADIIVADMTGKNPNVFFEVGYAKAINKKLILLTQSKDDIPFDLKHYNHIVYEGKIVELKESLSISIEHYLTDIDKTSDELQLSVDLTLNGILLTPNEETTIPKERGTSFIRLSIKNRTNTTIKKDKLQIGAIGQHCHDCWPQWNRKIVYLSKNETMYLYTQQSFRIQSNFLISKTIYYLK